MENALPPEAPSNPIQRLGSERRIRIQPKANVKLRTIPDTRVCKACGKDMPYVDRFCPHCGHAIRKENSSTEKRIQQGTQAIKWVAILFFFFGTLMGINQIGQANTAKENLADYDDAMVWPVPIQEKTLTVGELRSLINREVVVLFVVNYFLGTVMIGLYILSRKNPFPATTTALGLYLAVLVLNALINPETLLQGVIFKFFVITTLMGGIKTSLASRVMTQNQPILG